MRPTKQLGNRSPGRQGGRIASLLLNFYLVLPRVLLPFFQPRRVPHICCRDRPGRHRGVDTAEATALLPVPPALDFGRMASQMGGAEEKAPVREEGVGAPRHAWPTGLAWRSSLEYHGGTHRNYLRDV